MNKDDNQKALDYVQMIILATDVGSHLRILEDLRKTADKIEEATGKQGNIRDYISGHPEEAGEIERLAFSLCMTASDLSDQSKDWNTTKKTAVSIRLKMA